MKKSVLLLFLILGAVASVKAEIADFDKIKDMLEYNKRMVTKIEDYLRDRAKIPNDYAGAADKEFLRKAKMEKPIDRTVKPGATEKSSGGAKSNSAPSAAPVFQREY